MLAVLALGVHAPRRLHSAHSRDSGTLQCRNRCRRYRVYLVPVLVLVVIVLDGRTSGAIVYAFLCDGDVVAVSGSPQKCFSADYSFNHSRVP